MNFYSLFLFLILVIALVAGDDNSVPKKKRKEFAFQKGLIPVSDDHKPIEEDSIVVGESVEDSSEQEPAIIGI
ncbi:unnamed protein product [Caenorhabditis sp. 36 PRJEB53466]|nr:unnamed protein product [Caenorhabditis sp. 36 PRJEB53466]